MDARASGHCLCGAVSFEVHGPLRDILLCHCEECRRWLGNVGSFSATHTDDLVFLEDRGLRWYTQQADDWDAPPDDGLPKDSELSTMEVRWR